MWSARRGSVGVAVLIAAACCGPLAGTAAAQEPENFGLNQGAFPSLALTWQAYAVQPDATLIDLYDDQGILFQSYATQWQAPPKKGVVATGQRPLGLPTTAALVAGVTGKKVKRVKIFYAGAPTQQLATLVAPPHWGFAGRFFASGTTVAETSASTTQVVTQIKALDGRKRLLSKTTSVFTNPF